MSPHRANVSHWLWGAYVVGMCVAAAVGVVMLDHRFPGNVPIAVTALAAIVVCWRSDGPSSVPMNSIGEPWSFSRQ